VAARLSQQRAALAKDAGDVLEERPCSWLERRERVVQHVTTSARPPLHDADVVGREGRHRDGVGQVPPRAGEPAVHLDPGADVARQLRLDQDGYGGVVEHGRPHVGVVGADPDHRLARRAPEAAPGAQVANGLEDRGLARPVR